MPKFYVPPSGPPNARIALVGEQPGQNEVRRRKPFVGAAGRELGDCMAAAGMLRGECYFTNTIKDLDAPIKSYINIKGHNVSTTPPGDAYIEELRKELSKLSPNVVIAVGNIALFALCSRTGITKWRGSVRILRSSASYSAKLVASLICVLLFLT